ncbi:TIGR02147 family protein [Pseudobacteriovorax antillogorgiicola]|uniref:TIGR02147 family protein n=1 Tax=Pseudobacteriovorax antillogorgiicola TaxID=1513793 RepID=A0A1Y6CL35_9BACT|nr:TIGR02147 family protein [Pseudobacteriovorax antillogorgiicola]TCS45445.1 uncharacterized protein (TIGR02147 family) [Pseudobacteriovorax antillogorgiicola]SMF74591.1 TIGR02147 family protein [Pseudobacteriovorax antillogorgiicola]
MARQPKLQKVEKSLHVEHGLVTVTIDPEMVEILENAPQQVMGHARLLLAGLRSGGKIDAFELMPDDLKGVWDLLKVKNLPRPLSILIGLGGPKIQEINIDLSPKHKDYALVTIDLNSEEMKRIHPYWLEYYLNKRLEKKNCDWKLDPSCIQSIWERKVHSKEDIRNYPLAKKTEYNPRRHGKRFAIRIRPYSLDIYVILGDLKGYEEEELSQAIIKDIQKAIFKLSVDPRNSGVFKVFVGHIQKQIHLAYHGPAAMGYGFPMTFLGGLAFTRTVKVQGVDPLLPMAYLKSLESKLDIRGQNLLGIANNELDIERCAKALLRKRLIRLNKEKDLQVITGRVLLRGFIAARQDHDYCRRGMEVAQEGLTVKKAHRDYKTMMIGVAKNAIPEYMELYQNFKREATLLLQKSRGRDLYHFNLQFFPLTRIAPKPVEQLREENEDFRDSRWCNLLIREMVGLPGVKDDPTWFGLHMNPGIPISDIKSSLSMLKRGGFLKYDQLKGRLSQTTKDIIAEEPSYLQGIQFHTDVLNLALLSEAWKQPDQGDFISISFTTDDATRKEIQKVYDRFLYQIFERASKTSEPNGIYQLSVQLFPLMRGSDLPG